VQIINQEYDLVPVDALKPHPRNPRRGDTVVIAESIIQNGFYGAVVAQKGTGLILAGNHRWKAAKDAGATEIPVVWVEADDKQALRILLADNRTNDLAGYDDKALADLLSQVIEGGGLTGTGYDQAAVDELLASLGAATPDLEGDGPEAKVDRAEELREKWSTERGQLWEIGRHRLLCGDSTVATDVERLLAGAKPVLMATDPPYGVKYDSEWRAKYSSGNYSVGKIENDDKADWREVWALWNVPILYVWHGGLHADVVAASLEACGYELRAQIIWNKSVMVFGRGAYHWKHEPCWYAVRKGANANWQGDRSQTTVWDCGNGSGAGRTGDDADNFHAAHISQKPVELFRRPILNHTVNGDVVAEPFAGSGSQFVAAEQLSRVCLGMEYEPKYVAVILERMSEMGLKPKLLNG
jgi:DNA modification methylase